VGNIRVHEVRKHTGVSNASAAVLLEPGGTKFLVADDEDNKKTVLRAYDLAGEGGPEGKFVLSNAALDPDPAEPEIDLEGAAWLGSRIFWIGSHSRSKNNEPRPSRRRLFATTFAGDQLQVSGTPYQRLADDMAAAALQHLGLDPGDVDPPKAPKEGGLSIEGLAATGTPGELIVGVRSPVFDKGALLVRLSNAGAVVDQGSRARLAGAVLLDLGGLGVRSIEYWKERDLFLIVGGPVSKGSRFRLFQWAGGQAPAKPLDFDLDDVTPESAAPEGLFIDPDREIVYIIFDEGNRADSDQDPFFRSVGLEGL
jgi:hypothetical protein